VASTARLQEPGRQLSVRAPLFLLTPRREKSGLGDRPPRDEASRSAEPQPPARLRAADAQAVVGEFAELLEVRAHSAGRQRHGGSGSRLHGLE